MSKHTSGPWVQPADMVPVIVAGEKGEKLIASAAAKGMPHAEQCANARLIAAAPDLLSALEAAEHRLANLAMTCEQWARESTTGGWSTHQVRANKEVARETYVASAKARAAIAKAKGETP